MSGDIYVGDGGNANLRVAKFTAWGEFLRSWGWDVVASGPGDTAPINEFEICVPGIGDLCKGGLAGGGAGEFGGGGGPQGVAIDSAGDVYVTDLFNRRVQKFNPDGKFLLTFGGDVNKTKVEEVGATETERNLCPIDPGDVCQAGTQGSGKGQFGFWSLGSYIAVNSNGTEVAVDDTIYVGDQGRVQEFDSGGHYVGDLPDPDKVLSEGGTVNSLALDPASGALYLGFFRDITAPRSKPDVHKLSADGTEICVIEAHNPSAIGIGSEGQVYLIDGASSTDPREIARYNSACEKRELLFEKEDQSSEAENEFSLGAGFNSPTGLAVSSACGIEGVDLFISNPDAGNPFIKVFGSAPQDFDVPCKPPPLIPPSIEEQFASSVSSNGAVVRAKINPHFWPDTTYSVQYGTEQCVEDGWEAVCVKEQPIAPILLSESVIDAQIATKGIFLGASETLVPDSTYRYRFISQSAGGGPTLAAERSFHTLPLPAQAKVDCPNHTFRTGASASLPDCRAYELVSPLEKNNGDIARPREVIDQVAPSGELITFGAFNAFGDPAGAPLFGQYLAQRDPTKGWTTRSINAPRSGVELIGHEEVNKRFKLFSEDLCSGWLLQDTDVPLVKGEVPRGVANLYRRHGLHSGCGAAGYELLSTVFPPHYGPGEGELLGASLYYPAIQGFAADGSISVFRAPAALTEEACDKPTKKGPKAKGTYQTYLSDGGEPGVPPKLVSVLPGGEAACNHSSVGTAQTPIDDSIYHAVSQDASRVYWTETKERENPTETPLAGQEAGKIYLRLNPTQPQSAFELGSATGVGNLTIGSNKVNALLAAGGTGTLSAGSTEVTALNTTIGKFVVGQPITQVGGKIPAGVTIQAVDEENHTLTFSAAATGSGSGVSIESRGPMPFEVGQDILGPGIPPGTAITGLAAGSLTLSANATQKQTEAPLTATSGCIEPAKACTLPVSADAEALSETSASRYLSAASDGSIAIFSTGGGPSGADLYEFDLAKALADEMAVNLIAHQVKGILGTSEDASRVYLVSGEDLDEGATAGQPNLYLYERGVGFGFIATMDDHASLVDLFPSRRASRITPDGLHVAFTTADPNLAEEVAGYDNADAISGRLDRLVYLYSATDESLVCVSCNPTGARPAGRLVDPVTDSPDDDIWAAARVPGWITPLHPGNILSTDGSRLFFESFEPLVPRDTNGRGDIYEWERVEGTEKEAKEECLEEIGGELFLPASSGCLGLISSGQGSSDAELIDASADGRDVFFLTNASLLPQDTDFQDIYDARAGGGFPPPIPPEPECEGDACQNPPAPPASPTPASAVPPQSTGNLPDPKKKPRCAKGKRRVVSKGKARCVPKKKKQHKRHSHRGASR